MKNFGTKGFPRRLFLTGTAGVTLGLPFLETFASKVVRAASPDDPGYVAELQAGAVEGDGLAYVTGADHGDLVSHGGSLPGL